jgi:hypothetical protein
MEKEFVPYEEALVLKELLGFDEPCLAYWDDDKVFELTPEFLKGSEMDSTWLTRPTFSQAFRWFREKYNLCVVIKPIDDKNLGLGYNLTKNGLIMKACTTYETAELDCLKQLIEIAKSK